MSTYHTGDRVRITANFPDYPFHGLLGTVARRGPYFGYVDVLLDDYPDSGPGLFMPDEIERVESE